MMAERSTLLVHNSIILTLFAEKLIPKSQVWWSMNQQRLLWLARYVQIVKAHDQEATSEIFDFGSGILGK